MSQVITTISAADRQVIDDYVRRMQSEYERLEQLDANSDLIQSIDTPANYRNTQVVAAWDGESALQESAYFKVSYREMNASGFTFWMAERPTTPYFVVIVADKSVKLKTRVIDVQPDSTTDEDLFIVETEFEGTF